MDRMTTEQMNKEVWLWLDKTNCWHEWIPNESPFARVGYYCKHCAEGADYPDNMVDGVCFDDDAGAVQLLRLMMGREDWDRFHDYLMAKWDSETFLTYLAKLITTPGKLLKAVHEWSKEHPK